MQARRLEISERFDRAVRRLGVAAGSPAGRALASTLAAMRRANLPGPQDAETLVPPVRRRWFRRVPGQNLWLYFRFTDDALTASDLTDQPPIPIDD